MRAEVIPVDTAVFGRPVLAIHGFDPTLDFTPFEAGYRAQYDPAYVYLKLPLADLPSIHAAESAGFRMVDCQIRASVKLKPSYDTAQYPYTFEQVTTPEALAPVLAIAGGTFTHDRISADPLLPPGLSGRRYQAYVRQSFESQDERVYRLVDRATRETVAFKTHRRVSATEVVFLLGGVLPEYKGAGVGLINEYCEFQTLASQGIRKGVTHVSAANHPVVNLELAGLGFRVVETFAVLRRMYGR